jgi:hypothetical protein
MSALMISAGGRSGLLAALLLLGPTGAGAQDYAPGEKLTLINCGRCHVVSAKNRMGGIDSTPSFAALRTFEDWEAKMKAFWTYRPHPAFTQIEGVTEPFPENRPAYIHPISLTLEGLAVIIKFARTIKPADLGHDLGMN